MKPPLRAPPSGVNHRPASTLPGARCGNYELVTELFGGSLVSTWAAMRTDAATPTRAIVIRLKSAVAENPTLRGAFVRDARALMGVDHARVANVLEVTNTGGCAFAALEFVKGLPLAELILATRLRGDVLPMAAQIELCSELARALAHLHRNAAPGFEGGRVHGDLGPHSIWVTPAGRVCLMPTGLGVVSCHAAAPAVADHLRYKAPEQIAKPLLGKSLEPTVDVYAFGALLWELCTGRPPFEADDPRWVATAVGTVQLPPLIDEVDTSQGLSYLVGRALSADRKDRFLDGAELRDALTVVERRLQRGLTARRKFRPPPAEPGRKASALAEAFERLVGDRQRQLDRDLDALLGANT